MAPIPCDDTAAVVAIHPIRQLQQERKQNLELAREVHTEKAHADRARQEVDALTQTKQAVEAAHT